MIITIDGPAGVGKSTIAHQIAKKLQFQLLDTGAMYRAITYRAMTEGTPLADPVGLANFALQCRLGLQNGTVTINDTKVGQEIRTTEVSSNVHYVADNLSIRKFLVQQQRQIGAGQDIVTEGRDQGTVVFPDAACKFFLTAGDEVRARRRVEQLVENGQTANFTEILAQQKARDHQDKTRPVGKLMKAFDAITVETDHLSPKQVLKILCDIATKKRAC